MANPRFSRFVTPLRRPALATACALAAIFTGLPANAALDTNEPGLFEPFSSALEGRDIRVPNTDQSVDGAEQSNAENIEIVDAVDAHSLLGHPITQLSSPNDDMRLAIQGIANAAADGDSAGMEAYATELKAILYGTTEGRAYDGFSMLNFNRWKSSEIGPEHFPPDAVPEEYKTKTVSLIRDDNGDPVTNESPFDGEQRQVWEADISMVYYDGQIDSDTFLLKFPFRDANNSEEDELALNPEVEQYDWDDTVQINYTIYGLAPEDFSPTMVMLDRREQLNTVQFPFKGMDHVWIGFEAGEVLKVTVKYPPVRMLRGVYTWGWRVHPPRIQFLQPVFELFNQVTKVAELDPQSESYAYRNREELTLDSIGDAAPEMKMLKVANAVLDGESAATIEAWVNDPNLGPRGTWVDWTNLAKFQTQLPPEAWDILLAEDGLEFGDYGDFSMVSVFLNNEMYGEGPALNEIRTWLQGENRFAKLINLDNHTHYFRNVDFGPRLHDDILRCCAGGFTSFEIFNFKPSYGAPKVAEMQWRAGWGFRPHFDVIQQPDVFLRGRDRTLLAPYTGGFGSHHFGYRYSEEGRDGDFRFNPPDFIVSDIPGADSLRDADGEPGLLIGQHTEGYGVQQMCPQDPLGDFCQTDFGPFNPNGALNWPEPNNPDVEKTELRFPPFLRNPDQVSANAGDIIPPTGAWKPFIFISPYNGTIWNDPADPSQGFWVDGTYGHGAPVFQQTGLNTTIEMPRSSGQVFYQFDDLFHDNSIFSPHPLTDGSDDTGDEKDSLFLSVARETTAAAGDTVLIRGKVTEFIPTGTFAEWVTVHAGAADAEGCPGEILAVTQVKGVNGRFWSRIAADELQVGANVCVSSLHGGYDERIISALPQ